MPFCGISTDQFEQQSCAQKFIELFLTKRFFDTFKSFDQAPYYFVRSKKSTNMIELVFQCPTTFQFIKQSVVFN